MIFNKTKGITVSLSETKAYSKILQTLGLMFSPKKNLIMKFQKPQFVSLHNYFVFYPLEILLLDKNKKIIEINYNLKPFTFWSYEKRKITYVVELAKKRSKDICKIGDILEFR